MKKVLALVLTTFVLMGFIINVPVTSVAADSLAKPVIKISVKGNTVKVKISKVKDAVSYDVYMKAPGEKKYIKIGNIWDSGKKTTTYKVENLTGGTYRFKVRACKKGYGDSTVYSPYSKVKKEKVTINKELNRLDKRAEKILKEYQSVADEYGWTLEYYVNRDTDTQYGIHIDFYFKHTSADEELNYRGFIKVEKEHGMIKEYYCDHTLGDPDDEEYDCYTRYMDKDIPIDFMKEDGLKGTDSLDTAINLNGPEASRINAEQALEKVKQVASSYGWSMTSYPLGYGNGLYADFYYIYAFFEISLGADGEPHYIDGAVSGSPGISTYWNERGTWADPDVISVDIFDLNWTLSTLTNELIAYGVK